MVERTEGTNRYGTLIFSIMENKLANVSHSLGSTL